MAYNEIMVNSKISNLPAILLVIMFNISGFRGKFFDNDDSNNGVEEFLDFLKTILY